MKESKLQNELLQRGASAKALVLLKFLIESLCDDVKGADLQKLRPLFFREARDVKQAFDELIDAELINGKYLSGNLSDVTINAQLYRELTDISGGITIVKKTQPKVKAKTDDVDDVIKGISLHYNSYVLLPRPSTLTPLLVNSIEEKLKIFPPEEIKEAITFVSQQAWVLNKADDKWMNMNWIIKNIEGFVSGGKYRKELKLKTNTAVVAEENSEIIW